MTRPFQVIVGYMGAGRFRQTTSEPHGTVTVTVNTGTGYTRGSSATVQVSDDDTPPPTPTYQPLF
ncbi:MAG: hypothetical protein OXN44_08310 [Acidimicrobiaceae bacterium]|nr:hypothetical protein [Acidimicrobiaceae bacterium]